MKKLLSKTLLTRLGLVVISLLVCLSQIGAYAWFSGAGKEVDTNISQGTVIKQYFHSGDGSEGDPFVITRPIHYYHLVELYQRRSSFANSNYHFKVGTNLDSDPSTIEVYDYDEYGNYTDSYSDTLNMEYYSGSYSLLPIGTSAVPFNGSFDGQGLTIKNLHVTATETIGDETYGTSDIGIFGYLGSSAVIKNCYYDNVSIDVTGVDPTVSTTDVTHRTTVHDLNSDGTLETCYVGYLAGHVSQSTQFNHVYINNSTILGGAGTTSSFGYYGCVEKSDGTPLEALSEEISTLKTAGDEAGFGGSMDMYSLHTRLVNVYETAEDNSLSTYVSAEQVDLYPSNPENNTVVATGWTNTKSQWATSYYFYETPNYDGGSYNISENSSNNSYAHIRLFSNSTYFPKTVTTYTHYGDDVQAFTIESEGNYLVASTSGVSSTTSSSSASLFVKDTDNHIFVTIDGWKYYLNKSGTNGLSMSREASSTWSIVSNTIYTVSNSSNYYLYYQNGWRLTNIHEMYQISDGEGHYLGGDTTSVYNETNHNKSIMWNFTNESITTSGTSSIYTIINDTNYYLMFNAGSIEMSTSSTPTEWNISVDTGKYGIYYTYNNAKYYLTYQSSGGWATRKASSYVISDGTHYLSTNGTVITNVSKNSESVAWSFSTGNSQTISCSISGTTYYLALNDSTFEIIVQTSPYTWTITDKAIYKKIHGTDFYILYNNGWEVNVPASRIIKSSQGNYLLCSGSTISSTSNSNEATRWLFSSFGNASEIAFTDPEDKHYLAVSGTTLTTSTSSYTWYYDSNGYYADIDGNKWYLLYDNGWKISLLNWFYITDGTHYLSTDGSIATNADISTSVKWLKATDKEYSGQEAYYTYVNGTRTKYYLAWVNNAFTVSTSTSASTFFYSASNNNGFYRIPFNGETLKIFAQYKNGWTMDVASGNRLSNDSYYLVGTTGGSISPTSTANNATLWQFSSYDESNTATSTTIYFYENATKYYLSYSGTTLSTSTALTKWTQVGSSFYYTDSNSVKYYLDYYNGSWVARDIRFYTITNGSNYLTISGGAITNTTDYLSSAHWTLSNGTSGTLSATVSGTTYYLKFNPGSASAIGTLGLTTDSSAATSWTYSNNTLYYTYGPTHQCITYDNGWKIKQVYFNGQVITDGTNYIKVTNSSSFTNTTNSEEATRFYFSDSEIYTNFYNNTTQSSVYLQCDSGTLKLGSSSSTWVQGDTMIYRTPSNVFDNDRRNYFLVFKDNVWTLLSSDVFVNNGVKISGYLGIQGSSSKVYLAVNSDGSIASPQSNSNNGSVWIYNEGGTLFTYVNGVPYYLVNDGNSYFYTTNDLATATSKGHWKIKDDSLAFSCGDNNYLGVKSNRWFGRTSSAMRYLITMTAIDSGYGSALVNKNTTSDPKCYYTIKDETSPTIVAANHNKTISTSVTSKSLSTPLNIAYESDALTTNTNITIIADKLPLLTRTKLARSFTLNFTNTSYARVEKTVEEQKGGLASIIPISVSTDSSGNFVSGFPASDTNTGYIVSGVNADAGLIEQFYGDVRVSKESMSGLSSSLNGKSSYSTPSELSVLTINGSGTYRIKDSYNKDSTSVDGDIESLESKTIDELGYSTYTEARDQLGDILTSSGSNVYGLHFVDSAISMSNITTAKKVKILGNTYTNYQLPEDSIDFNVICRGKISFFAGSYYSTGVNENDAFFSLHQIYRSSSTNEINSIKEISKIYMSRKSGANKPYIYLYTDGTYTDADGGYSQATSLPSGYDEVFDTTWITNPSSMIIDALYYFEIPCNAGEYALGSVSGKNGAYLIYLDIGSAGGETQSSIISTEGNEVSGYQVDFRDSPDTVYHNLLQLSYAIPSDSSNTNFSVKVEFDSSDTTNHSEGCYKIYITNKTGSDVELNILLMDNDEIYGNDYNYAYELYVTNNDVSNYKVPATEDKDYFQSIGTFNITSSGTPTESSYSNK